MLLQVAIVPFYVDLAFRLAGGLEGAEATEGSRMLTSSSVARLDSQDLRLLTFWLNT